MAQGARAQPGTFSIVARDSENGDLGVATQSRFIAVGAVVPWARAEVGAVATQAQANVSFGPDGLDRLDGGAAPAEVIAHLIEDDPNAPVRQVGMVDGRGQAAAFTGEDCLAWAGHVVGKGFCTLGNILAAETVVHDMASAFEGTTENLPERLLAALRAGQGAGGDRRGQQSAALLVVRKGGSYGGFSDRYVDVRVDDHPTPIAELERVFQIYDLTLLEREDPQDVVRLEGAVAEDVQSRLAKAGIYQGPVHGRWSDESEAALERFFRVHNFENKWRDDGRLWGSVYRYLRERLPRD
ncbi:MAG: DUF1028 domain-containing protein [Thermoplasmata archaeon]